MVNMLFWFIMRPTDDSDPVKTIVTRSVHGLVYQRFKSFIFHSMAAVLTSSMTLRIILSVRGSLEQGGSFSVSASVGNSSRATHVISGRSGNASNISQPPTFTLDELQTKREGQWGPIDNSSLSDSKEGEGVKITIDRNIDVGGYMK